MLKYDQDNIEVGESTLRQTRYTNVNILAKVSKIIMVRAKSIC